MIRPRENHQRNPEFEKKESKSSSIGLILHYLFSSDIAVIVAISVEKKDVLATSASGLTASLLVVTGPLEAVLQQQNQKLVSNKKQRL